MRSELTVDLVDDGFPGSGMYVWCPADGRIDWSPGLLRIFGRKAPPASEAEFMAWLHPDDRVRVEGETEAFLTGQSDTYSHSFRIVRPDGEVRLVLDRAQIARDDERRVVMIRGQNIDLTDIPHLAKSPIELDTGNVALTAPSDGRGHTDAAHPERNERTGGPLLAEIDYRSGTVTLGARDARLFGLGDAATTVRREALHAIFHPDDRAWLAASIEAALDPETGGELEAEHRIRLPDGSERWVQVRKRIDFETRDGSRRPGRGILAVADITDRKLAEAGMRASTERLAFAEDLTGIGFVDVNLRDGTAFWSKGVYDLLQLDRSIPARPELFFERIHPEDIPEQNRVWSEAVETGAPLKTEYRVVRPDGSTRHVVARGHAIHGTDGRVDRYAGVTLDVTDRKMSELSLHESEARLALAQNVVGIGVWDVDMRTGKAVWTDQMYDLLQIERDIPASPETFFERVHPDDVDRVRSDFDGAIGDRSDMVSEFRIVRPNGEIRHVIGRGRVVEEENGRPVRMIGVNYDITDRKAVELDLHQRTQRQEFLVELGDALRASADAREAMAAAAGLLGRELDVACVGYAEVDADGRVRTEGEYNARDEPPKFVGKTLDLVGLGAETASALGRGDVACLTDIETQANFSEAERNALRALDVQSYVAVPLLSGGRLKAYLFAAHDAAREWSETEIALLRDTAERTNDTVARARSESASRASEARYRTLFESIDAGFCVVEVRFEGPEERVDYRVVEANPAFYERTGFPRPILGLWLREAAPGLEEHWFDLYGGVARTGQPARFEEHSELLDRWFDVYAFRIDAPEHRRVAILFHDISERRRHEEHTRTLLKEVNHRSKNMLSLVNVIAKRTAASDAKDFASTFSDRLSALAANQDVLVRSDWKTVDLEDLVRAQLEHFQDLLDGRILMDGPSVSVRPEAAEKLGMAFHELATNAGKYGALSTETGHVRISWRGTAGEQDGFVLEWREAGGPAVTAPEKTGFGSLVYGSLLESGLSGSVEADYAPEGLHWTLSCPLAMVTEAADEVVAPANVGRESDGGTGAVLVVEDDPLQALSVAELLAEDGLSVIGPAHSADHALALIERTRPACAVLDIHLGKETSEGVAIELRRLGVPFLCVTAYSTDQMPVAFEGAAILPKPLDSVAFLKALHARTGEGRSSGFHAP